MALPSLALRAGATKRGARRRDRLNSPGRRARRVSERQGRLAEWVAAVALVIRGYRVLARRHRSVLGEIDLIAVRGRRLAFVEVKLRPTLEAAQLAITPKQMRRMRAAANRWVWRHSRYRDCEIGLDAMLLAPRRWPRHLPNALSDR